MSQAEEMASAKALGYAVQIELLLPSHPVGPQGREDFKSREWTVQIYS